MKLRTIVLSLAFCLVAVALGFARMPIWVPGAEPVRVMFPPMAQRTIRSSMRPRAIW